jgi:hypothetical protein
MSKKKSATAAAAVTEAAMAAGQGANSSLRSDDTSAARPTKGTPTAAAPGGYREYERPSLTTYHLNSPSPYSSSDSHGAS